MGELGIRVDHMSSQRRGVTYLRLGNAKIIEGTQLTRVSIGDIEAK